jgi:hypothetical protein
MAVRSGRFGQAIESATMSSSATLAAAAAPRINNLTKNRTIHGLDEAGASPVAAFEEEFLLISSGFYDVRPYGGIIVI